MHYLFCFVCLQIHVGMPDALARRSILQVLLRGERAGVDLDIDGLAAATEGYSGSDLKELVRAASMGPIREALSRGRPTAASDAAAAGGAGAGAGSAGAAPRTLSARGISNEDFGSALREVKPSGSQARSYYVEALRSGQGWGDSGTGSDGGSGGSGAGGAGAGGGRSRRGVAAARGEGSSGAAGGAGRLNVGPAAAAAAAPGGAGAAGSTSLGAAAAAAGGGDSLDGPTFAVLMAGHSMRANTDALTAAVEEKARQQSPVKSSPQTAGSAASAPGLAAASSAPASAASPAGSS